MDGDDAGVLVTGTSDWRPQTGLFHRVNEASTALRCTMLKSVVKDVIYHRTPDSKSGRPTVCPIRYSAKTAFARPNVKCAS